MGPLLAVYVITDKEAQAFDARLVVGGAINVWGDILAPLLWSKGCPKDATVIGNPHLQMRERKPGDEHTTFELYEKAA